MSSSADMGIGLKGNIAGNVNHWLTITNGTGYSSAELDPFKKIGYALWLDLANGLTIEGYADYEKQDPENPNTKGAPSGTSDFSISTGYYTLKAMVAFEQPSFSVAAEVFSRTNKESGITNVMTSGTDLLSYEKADVNKMGYSVFGSVITPIPKLKAFARYDYYDANTEDDVVTGFSSGSLVNGLDNEMSMLFLGLDYIPTANIHFMPNVIIKSYADSDKDSDIIARVTLWFNYSSGKLLSN
jgi:hypothetical protein